MEKLNGFTFLMIAFGLGFCITLVIMLMAEDPICRKYHRWYQQNAQADSGQLQNSIIARWHELQKLNYEFNRHQNQVVPALTWQQGNIHQIRRQRINELRQEIDSLINQNLNLTLK